MFKRWSEFLEKHRTEPEESVAYRVGVTVLVMFALVLTLHQLEWPSYWPVVVLMTPAASVLSYYRRDKANIGLKIFLSFAMIALLLWFFMRLSTTLYDPRLPLAELLVWLQTLHAFDLPAKKDLRYTGLVALILMAIACVLTYSSYFALMLMIFCVLFLSVMAVDFWAGNRTPGTTIHRERPGAPALDPRWLGQTLLVSLPLALLGATVIFAFMPRYQGLKLRSLPVSWDMNFNFGEISQGDIVNQGLNKKGNNSGKPQRVDGDSYFGFDSEVNLNARGKMSNKVVLKVRTSNWQYHRGVTFSEYTGSGWKSIPWEPQPQTVNEPPFFFRSVHWEDERVTIYYAETDLPNVIFTPSNPRRLYFPSNTLYLVTSFDSRKIPRKFINTPATLVAPVYLEMGLVYSVLNQMPAEGSRALSQQKTATTEGQPPPEYLEDFLQLPDSVTPRTRRLARELTQKQTSRWGKAAALTTYLQQNFTYNLGVDFYPEGVDTVDYFLFSAKEGYCEQFATALCVMARSVGIPARYVTGYLPGTFNPVSGFYEIKASDAHAWAELYLEDYGWMIFDPVPGGNATPQLADSEQHRWLLESLLEYLEVPKGVRGALPALVRLFIVLAVISLALVLFRRSRKAAELSLSEFAPYLLRAERLTETRKTGETVKQWAERLPAHPQLQVLARIYEERFYRDLPLEESQRRELEDVLSELESMEGTV